MLSAILSVTAFAMTAVLSIPSAFYALECLVASLAWRMRPCLEIGENRRPSIAVLVPAHNEESGIAATLASISSQLAARDRLVVVADNCTDQTAQLAKAAGVEIVERFDRERRGKGFALDAGIRHLEKEPPEIVVMIDADCHLGANALERLAAAVVSSGKPVQSCNLMMAPAGAPINHAVAEFAFLVKNHVRPLGLAHLGLPCQVTGTGIAIPWAALACAHVAHANRVEDMKLGLDLARAGHAPRFCEQALVTSQFPCSEEGAGSQRRRWEGGHLGMIRTEMRALLDSRTYLNVSCLALTLDLMVPPLTLLLFLLLSALLFTAVLAALGLSILPLAIAATNLALVFLATFAAWLAYGQKALPPRSVGKIPLYVAWKVKLYPRTLFGGAREGWIRTAREKSRAPET